MKTYKTITKEISVTDTIRCTHCEKDIAVDPQAGQISGCHVTMYHGYGSVRDGDTIFFELCDACAAELIKPFESKCVVDSLFESNI